MRVQKHCVIFRRCDKKVVCYKKKCIEKVVRLKSSSIINLVMMCRTMPARQRMMMPRHPAARTDSRSPARRRHARMIWRAKRVGSESRHFGGVVRSQGLGGGGMWWRPWQRLWWDSLSSVAKELLVAMVTLLVVMQASAVVVAMRHTGNRGGMQAVAMRGW